MDEIYVDKNSALWEHTKMRIDNAAFKAKDRDDFVKRMIQRLMKMKHKDKLDYAKYYLKQLGYDDIVEIYESKELMDILSEN